jgi:hypothetical protein
MIAVAHDTRPNGGKDMEGLDPEAPDQAGVDEEQPDASRVEGARELADQAGPRLRAEGFDDDEIRRWADTYIAEEGSGDVDGLVRWIAEHER